MRRNAFQLPAILCAILLLAGCMRQEKGDTETTEKFTDEVLLGMTPVKDQRQSNLCWAYAMLATIETEHIGRGDSVNLSAAYVARMFMKEQVEECYLGRGMHRITLRGVMPQLVRLIQTYGLMPWDAYHSDAALDVAARKLTGLVKNCAARGTAMDKLQTRADWLLDNTINPLPRNIYMYSMEYTPVEFAHSVCLPDEYRAFTSFTHKPVGEKSELSLPDNYRGDTFENAGLDKLMSLMEQSLRQGHPVCWEGDVSEPGFSFEKGVADVPENQRNASEAMRQRQFETFRTTDDHCMALVGIARDRHGRKYFICKNSWGTKNPYGGLMYMSFDYARLKTVAVMLNEMMFS